NVADQLRAYLAAFSESAREVLDKFGFDVQIDRLDRANLLYLVLSKFRDVDLHPDAVSNVEMGYLYEELVRKFSELSNETAGEHFTPREVIRLMVDLLFVEDDEVLQRPGIVKTLFDPACGTGGMLSVAEDYLRELNPEARLQQPLRGRPAADQRRQLPLPPARDLEDEAGRRRRLPASDRLQRLAALHRRRRLRSVRDPPLDHRERLARGGRRAARPALL